jgi:type IV secretory pathway TraG/TraD family ATPase VirD4
LANQAFSKNEPPVKFAFLNFTDLSRTVRTNPISPKYVKTDLEILEIANVIMKNLEKEWIQKTDFWANNAINYMQGSLLMLSRNYPQFCTVPHLIELMLSSHDSVLNFLASDPQIHKIMVPILTAHEQQAKEQLAGVISSAQLPITKLRSPEVYYVLNPAEQNNFNLDITNPSNPIFLCVGNSSRLTNALGPIIALIASICMQQMNQLGKRRSLFVVDELPTLFIPNLDNLPATARKKVYPPYLQFKALNNLKTNTEGILQRLPEITLVINLLAKPTQPKQQKGLSKCSGSIKKLKSAILLVILVSHSLNHNAKKTFCSSKT